MLAYTLYIGDLVDHAPLGASVTATCSTPEGKESSIMFDMPAPLGVATLLGHEEVARLLLEGGADKDKMQFLIRPGIIDAIDQRATPLWVIVGLNNGECAFVFTSAPPVLPLHHAAPRLGGTQMWGRCRLFKE